MTVLVVVVLLMMVFVIVDIVVVMTVEVVVVEVVEGSNSSSSRCNRLIQLAIRLTFRSLFAVEKSDGKDKGSLNVCMPSKSDAKLAVIDLAGCVSFKGMMLPRLRLLLVKSKLFEVSLTVSEEMAVENYKCEILSYFTSMGWYICLYQCRIQEDILLQ